MPPSGPPYSEITANDPSTPTIEELADWIRTLDPNMEISEVPCADVPAPKVMHRLNRVEYNRAVQHLTGTNRPVTTSTEDRAYGLDNIAQALTVSPLLIEKYELAAKMLAEEMLTPVNNFRLDTMKPKPIQTALQVVSLANNGTCGPMDTYQRRLSCHLPGHTQCADQYRQQAGPDPARMAFEINGKIRSQPCTIRKP